MGSPAIFSGKFTKLLTQLGLMLKSGAVINNDGPKNYIGYNNFENGATTGWSLGTTGTLTNGIPTGTPTFGSGAAGTLAISAQSSGPLSGSYSLQYADSAATTAGNMVASDALAIDIEDQAKVLTYKLYYKVSVNPSNGNFSGTSSNSFGVAAYDVTNSSWLPMAGNFAMTQNSGVGIATGTFQTNATTASIRFVIYNANASAGAITMLFDDIYMGPQTAPIGFAGTDLTDKGGITLTYTGGGGTSPATYSVNRILEARLGDKAYYQYEMKYTAAGTAGTGDVLFALPAGRSFDSNKVTYYTTVEGATDWATAGNILGTAAGDFQGSAEFVGVVVPYDATHFRVALLQRSGGTSGQGYISDATFAPVGTSGSYAFTLMAPISGWSSNVQMSNDTDTRVIAAQITGAAATATAGNPIIFPTVTKDTAGAYNNATGRYTAQVTGFYDVRAAFRAAGGTTLSLYAYVNAVQNIFVGTLDTTSGLATAAGLIFLNAGDILDLRSSGGSVSAMASDASYSINRLSGPSVIAASESVIASYGLTTGQAVATNAVLKFDTLVKDSHNAYSTSTGLFTAPSSGTYEIFCGFSMTNAGGSYIKKNGSAVAYVGTAGAATYISGSYTLPLNAGDTIGIYCDNGSTYTATSANGYVCRLSIKRVGN